MNVTVPKGIKFTIIKRLNGMYEPQKEYGNRTLYPSFNTLRDAMIFMDYMEPKFKRGICGNVQVIEEEIL